MADDIPNDLRPDLHCRFNVLDLDAKTHQIGHRRLHLTPPFLARRERGRIERP